MISRRQWRKVLDANRRYRACAAKGPHIDSGQRSQAVMGGREYTVATCSRCGVRYVPEERRHDHRQ